jgi:rhodanese-related sulfurtransferase
MAFFDPRFLPPQDSRRIVLHCGSGMRSTRMAERCAAAGFDRIAHMAGGMSAWKDQGLPYIATDPATGGPVRK